MPETYGHIIDKDGEKLFSLGPYVLTTMPINP